MEGQFEEAVKRCSARVDGGDARWREHHMFLLGVLADVAQEGALPRSGLAGEKERALRVVHYLQGLLEFGVAGVDVHVLRLRWGCDGIAAYWTGGAQSSIFKQFSKFNCLH